MEKYPLWKPVLIVLVVAMCAWSIYEKGLKPGMDLAGGFVLTYDVAIPEGQDSASAIDQVISVLSKRVDPTGVRNLVWRRTGNNRLEIQAALAGPEVRKKRDDYQTAYDKLREGNVGRSQLESILKKPAAERDADFKTLATGAAARQSAFEALIAAHAAMEGARPAMTEAQRLADGAEADFKKLPPDAPEAQKKQEEERKNNLRRIATEKTKAYVDARNKLEPTMAAALATNVDPIEIDRVLALPNKTVKDKEGKESNAREKALKETIAAHQDRSEAIHNVVAAFNEYEKIRGPLDDPEDLISLLRGSGVLEFRIAPEPTPALQNYHDQLREKGPNTGTDKPFMWFAIDDVSTFAEREADRVALAANPIAFFQSQNMIGDKYGEKYYLLLSNQEGERLSAKEPNWRLDSAGVTIDQKGYPAVSFRLNTVGGQYLGDMTQRNLKRLMAIVLDNRAISAATIQSRIDVSGQISKGKGGYGQKELNYLIRTLNAGSLKATLSERPNSIKFFQAEAGRDNLQRGLNSGIISAILVFVFMFVYYFFWGGVANAAVIFNVVILLGVMALLQSTFTMAGIAGVVLTIGMSVDANVLIFERIREELTRGADVKTAVRLGFDKAFSAIFDGNVTTLITCLILGYFGTADVRGFAVSLGIGLMANLFTAVFCSRVIIDLWVRWFNPSTANMLPMVVPGIQRFLTPRIEWMSKMKLFAVISTVVIVGGLIITAVRGVDMLDIEFRSGTQVGFKLAEGKQISIQDARERLNKVGVARNMPELLLGVPSVVPVGSLTTANEASEFNISVLNENSPVVSAAVKEAFADVTDAERPISFKGSDDKANVPSAVRVVRSDTLGDSIGRESGEKVGEFVGGVAIVLENMQPAASVTDLNNRIRRYRSLPQSEALGYREFKVIGLDAATGDAARTASKEPLYTSAVVLVTDRATNYVESPGVFGNDVTGLAGTEWKLVRDALIRDSSLDSVSNFSSQVSSTMRDQAIVALILSTIAIGAYIWIRFGTLKFGTGAIVSLFHDVFVALAFVAAAGAIFKVVGPLLGLSDFKINLTMIAAFLTILGYSINDTIVVFDRIRELRGRLGHVSKQLINDAINQTLSRTMLTGGTTLGALLILYFIGGEAVKGFAFCMFVGILTGTYSSIAVAAPLLLWGAKDSTPTAPAAQPGTALTKPTA